MFERNNDLERKQLAPGVCITTLDASKFNRCRITLHLRFPAKRESATDAAVLALVLERGYAACPDMTALSRRLAELYGADLGVDLASAGTDRVLSADICGIKDAYALAGENLTAAYADIVFGTIFDPYLVDGAFDPEAVRIETETQARRLEAEFNSKRLYCVRQARRKFYGDTPAGIELGGYPGELVNVTPQSLKAEYDRILSTASIDVMVQGVDEARVADLLLVDDIQFIAGKESTQEEFFHTFNSLHDAHKQIVIASDRPAKEIKSLEERLRTRFEWGLTADVQPPDFETRVAIVKRKAELLHLDLPEDVAEFIANHLKNNIRQLEGAVKKLNAYYMLEGIQPVISVAQNAIKDILNETQPVPVTIEKIIGEVSRTFNVSPADIRGTKRNANVASARRVAIYILREVTGMSMEEIGREFSGRDHSTIVYSLKTMERDMKNDQHLRETVSDIIKNVKA